LKSNCNAEIEHSGDRLHIFLGKNREKIKGYVKKKSAKIKLSGSCEFNYEFDDWSYVSTVVFDDEEYNVIWVDIFQENNVFEEIYKNRMKIQRGTLYVGVNGIFKSSDIQHEIEKEFKIDRMKQKWYNIENGKVYCIFKGVRIGGVKIHQRFLVIFDGNIVGYKSNASCNLDEVIKDLRDKLVKMA
jgi:hypothetical protein